LQALVEIDAVGQPGMVAGDRKGEHAPDIVVCAGVGGARHACAGARMIAAAASLAADVSLERRRTLADVVQSAGEPPDLSPVEYRREFRRTRADQRFAVLNRPARQRVRKDRRGHLRGSKSTGLQYRPAVDPSRSARRQTSPLRSTAGKTGAPSNQP
jgi:hypothetical protein